MRIFYTFILLFSLSFSSVSAQALSEDISISIFPNEPRPGEIVSIRAESFGMNLLRASISWYQDNKLISSGVGKTEIKIASPGTGKATTISVTASDDISDASTSITIRPASVDVIWEAVDSYTPPFYKGKALPAVGSKLKITAVPSSVAPRSIAYSWKYNGNNLKNLSGVNKNTITIKTDVLSSNESFSVEASGGTFEGTASTNITLRSPEAVLYTKSNGFINYAKGSLQNMPILESGAVLRIEPFNFSINKSLAESLSINFNLDGQDVFGIANPQELPVTKPETSGQGSVVVNISSIKERLQSIKKTFNLSF